MISTANITSQHVSVPQVTIQLECGPVSAVDLALFAAASADHNPLHLDDKVARNAGFERPVVHGMLSMALVARLLTTYFGPQSLRSLEVKFTGAALRDMKVILVGQLQETFGTEATYQINVKGDSGTHLLRGTAKVQWSNTGNPP